MKRALLALLIFVSAGCGSAAPQEPTLKIATEAAYPPFNTIAADGSLHGFDIDIGNALCTAMHAKCEWVVQDWDGMIPALKAGKFDAIVSSMFITDERKKQVDFTERYYSTPPAVIVRKDSDIAGATPADLAGKSVGVQASSVYAVYADKFLRASDVRRYPAVPEMTEDLGNGRLDAINDDLIVLSDFLKSAAGACCRLAGVQVPDLAIHGPGAGIVVRKGDPLRARFDAALKAIRADGTYKIINDRYFDFDISGNVRR